MIDFPLYEDGIEIKVGDHVTFSGGHCGVVCLLIGFPEAGDGVVSSDWDYLQNGVLLSTSFGIIYYASDQLDMIKLKERAS